MPSRRPTDTLAPLPVIDDRDSMTTEELYRELTDNVIMSGVVTDVEHQEDGSVIATVQVNDGGRSLSSVLLEQMRNLPPPIFANGGVVGRDFFRERFMHGDNGEAVVPHGTLMGPRRDDMYRWHQPPTVRAQGETPDRQHYTFEVRDGRGTRLTVNIPQRDMHREGDMNDWLMGRLEQAWYEAHNESIELPRERPAQPRRHLVGPDYIAIDEMDYAVRPAQMLRRGNRGAIVNEHADHVANEWEA